MAEIGFIMFADEVFNPNPQSNDLMVRNPKVALTPEYIPGQFSFVVVFSLLGLSEGEEYELGFVLRHVETNDEVIRNNDIKFNFTQDKSSPVGLLIDGTVINLQLNNVVFKEEGKYELVVNIGDVVKSETINIFKANRG